MGFQLQGNYTTETPVLDLQEGVFVSQTPMHPYFLAGQLAEITSTIAGLNFYNELETISLNKNIRRQLLEAYQQYLALHIAGFGQMKSFAILQEVLA